MSVSAEFVEAGRDRDRLWEIRTRFRTIYRWSNRAAEFWEETGAEVAIIDLRDVEEGED